MTRRRLCGVLVMVLGCGLTAAADAVQSQAGSQLSQQEARERNLRAYTELLRSDIRTQKVALITQLMEFTEAEDAAFWPVYREYEFDLSRVNDERIQLIAKYGEIYTKLTDAQADDLVGKALDLEARRTALKQKYYAKLKAVLPPRVALKALHIEQQLGLIVDLQVAAALPIVTSEK